MLTLLPVVLLRQTLLRRLKKPKRHCVNASTTSSTATTAANTTTTTTKAKGFKVKCSGFVDENVELNLNTLWICRLSAFYQEPLRALSGKYQGMLRGMLN